MPGLVESPNGKPDGSNIAEKGPGILKPKNYARLFEMLGVGLNVNGSTEARADECPFCGKDRFSVNVTTGQYHCKKCQAKGNVPTFLTWLHGRTLEATKREHYLALKAKRGIASQTLGKHELAYDPVMGRWLIPFKGSKGGVVNLQLYYPDKAKPNKYNLPELPAALYGFHKLVSADKSKHVLLCEGPFDAIALDYSIGANNSPHYVIVASPGAFKEEWAEHFRGRKVRAFYDNDKGGEQHRERVRKLLGESGVAEELRVLRWPEGSPDGCDINDLIRQGKFAGYAEIPKESVLGWLMDHSPKVTAVPKLIVHHGRRGATDEKPTDWIWPDHLFCGSYASFSGQQGTFKSTIAQEIAARYTTGRRMPKVKQAGMPAGHVLYIHAEDDRKQVENGFEWAGGDFDKWHSMPATLKDGDPLNVLEHLGEIRDTVREFGIRLVIIDGQNSVVGAPRIDTDMQARCNVTNKLHQFAQRENVCLLGIRNEDKEGRALGPQSMADLGRCVLRVEETDPKGDPPYCKLIFRKVSDIARRLYPPIFFSVRDHGGSHREILWGKKRPAIVSLVAAAKAASKR